MLACGHQDEDFYRVRDSSGGDRQGCISCDALASIRGPRFAITTPQPKASFDIHDIRRFIECVIGDDKCVALGLFQGEIPRKVLAAAERLSNEAMPIASSEPAKVVTRPAKVTTTGFIKSDGLTIRLDDERNEITAEQWAELKAWVAKVRPPKSE